MEAFWFRRSSSAQRFRQGNGQSEIQRNSVKSASECTSWSGDTTDEDSFKREFGLRYSKQAVGTPIKRLLAEEMTRETESKKRSPSVIARLMGLEGMPSQPSSQKQERRSSEESMKKAVPAVKKQHQRSNASSSRGSSRKSSREEQEFKDVFEVLESSRKGVQGSSSLGSANYKMTEAEMAFIQQKFMDAKRLSTDGKLHDSKEFHDTIEDLNSNQDLLLRFLEQPDSMFTKHLHELHGVSPRSHSGGNVLVFSTEKETSKKTRKKPYEDRYDHSYSKQGGQQGPAKNAKVHIEGEKDSTIFPTRIVVLKPNLGQIQNSTKSISSSPRSSHGLVLDTTRGDELPSTTRSRESGKQKHADDARSLRYRSGEPRDIAKEVTRQVRNSFTSNSNAFTNSGIRGYAGDESSSCRSEYESANESDVTMVPSRYSFEYSGHRYRGSPSRSNESSVSREARKRLSERWKMTHKSVDMGVVSRSSSTLGEMLAITDRKVISAASSDSIDKLSSNHGPPNLVEPLGISSRDGWKDPFIKSLPRSKSVPASPAGGSGSPQLASHRRTVYDDSYRTAKESRSRARNKTAKGNLGYGEGLSSSRTSRARSRKSRTLVYTYSDEGDTSSPESPFGYRNFLHMSVPQENPIGQSRLVNEGSVRESGGLLHETESMIVDMVIDNVIDCSTSTSSELAVDTMLKTESAHREIEECNSQEQTPWPEKCSTPTSRPTAEPESSASSKETDQPSPVSVLETPFPDDSSSGSDCFENLSADLQGLRLQLKLLKLESESYDEGPMLVSSDDEDDSAPHSLHRQLLQSAERCKELSYTADVLRSSGIDNTDPNTFIGSLHSSECPVSLSVFEELEKTYCSSHKSWPRSERRLLFDRINSALMDINREFNDPQPWVRVQTKISSKWVKNGLEERVNALVESRGGEEQGSKVAEEEVLSGELQWLDLGFEMDAIGRDIERGLVEDLVIELVGAV